MARFIPCLGGHRGADCQDGISIPARTLAAIIPTRPALSAPQCRDVGYVGCLRAFARPYATGCAEHDRPTIARRSGSPGPPRPSGTPQGDPDTICPASQTSSIEALPRSPQPPLIDHSANPLASQLSQPTVFRRLCSIVLPIPEPNDSGKGHGARVDWRGDEAEGILEGPFLAVSSPAAPGQPEPVRHQRTSTECHPTVDDRA
jgi:hypothetical protein